MRVPLQESLWSQVGIEDVVAEDPRYLREQLLTYIGNKRSLLPLIQEGVGLVKKRLGTDRLSILDAFSGSGVVSRMFKQHAHRLVSNDFEPYAATVGRCYLTNRCNIDTNAVTHAVELLNEQMTNPPVKNGIIRRNYTPNDEKDILADERVFYTIDNAIRLDSYRTLITQQPSKIHDFLLGPLLSEASIHANTSGVFKGFYKNNDTGIGQYGGHGRNALERIMGSILLKTPVWSRFDADVSVTQQDTNDLVSGPESYDLAYFDPPYNQHPYGSNYFMLNLLLDYTEPNIVSPVSGIPTDWQRSKYNKRKLAAQTLEHALQHCKAKFLMISYNDEGFISQDQFDAILSRIGKTQVITQQYNTFRGSRNLRNRATHVNEHLFIVEKH
jgi:adenine-specific DNA-methyltransferase